MNTLAIDLGTTACKASVVTDDGRLLGSGLRPIDTTFGPGGAAEQDAELVWTSTLDACRQAIDASGAVEAARILTVCATSQWSSIVPVDADGRPVAPLLMWFDRRGAEITDRLCRQGGEQVRARWAEIHGFQPSTSLGHILWLQAQPGIHARTVAYLEPADYLNARLSGRIAATANTAMPLALTDNRTLGAVVWSSDLIERSGVDATRLPELVRSLSVLAPIVPEVADSLGIGRTVEVATAANDSIAGAFGSGALEPGTGAIMMGTTGVLTAHHRRRHVDDERFIVTMPSALDDRYYVVAEAGLGGKLIETALSQFGDAGAPPSDESFERMLASAAASPPGASGVMFLPWALGSMAPSPDRRHRGALVGLGLSTTPGDVARAMLEGISMQMRWLTDEVERATSAELASLRFVGGGAQSDLWSQVMADVVGRPIEQVAEPRHANARGAGLMGAVAAGRLAIDQLEGLVPIRTRYEPNPRTAAMYTERLDVFRRLHAVLAEPVARLTSSRPPTMP